MKNRQGPVKFFILGIFATVMIVSTSFAVYKSHIRMLSMEKELSHLKTSLSSKQIRLKRGVARDRPKQSTHRLIKRNAEIRIEEEPSVRRLGTAYTRWGRMDCSGKSKLVYYGYAAGSYHAHTGSGSNYLCLHSNLTYPEGKYVDGYQSGSHLYGVEWYESTWSNALFNYSQIHSNSMYFQSLSCAVCITYQRTTKIMIPGREDCPNGWNSEYTGYIMSELHTSKHASEYICVDDTPIPIPGTETQNQGAHLNIVEPDCHSLPCEPLVRGRELRCVVCTI